jgi:hypothetical protein
MKKKVNMLMRLLDLCAHRYWLAYWRHSAVLTRDSCHFRQPSSWLRKIVCLFLLLLSVNAI